jgi:peptide/nickel transport system substrate-binding protein
MTAPSLRTPRLLLAVCAAAGLLAAPPSGAAEPMQAIAMHGAPKEPAGFAHFPYANPDAPKGGRLVLGVSGSFDSVNPMIVKGQSAAGVREFVVESLMARSQDEPFTLYGLLAETVDVPPDRSSVTFRLNDKALFSDGKPVTADDVIFSLEILRDKGRPNLRTYYKKVARIERLSDREVRFVFDGGGDREMPLILGLMPVLPKHAWDPDKFDQTTLAPLLGSGPYRMSLIDPGRSITYTRDPSYWGNDLPANRGRFNFDEIRFDYFREASVQLEAFKLGQIDLRSEEDPARWAEGLDFSAVADGRVTKEEFETGLPAGMTALVFNTRRPVFQDPRVRQALIRLFNFEWMNKSLFHGLYRRTESYFERSSLASTGKPADLRERELLAPYMDRVRPEILDGSYRFPASDGTGYNREHARAAFELLKAAGYGLQNGRLVQEQTGAPFTFEVLAGSAAQDRLLSSFSNDLDKLGITAHIRVVDSAQYQVRIKDYDFDMMQMSWPASLSPGNEQLFRWSSAAAKTPGTFNYAGVENPAADAMIQALLTADTPEGFVSSVRALDRVLLSGDYVIPLFHSPKQWVASWRRLHHPEKIPLFGFNIDTWWAADGK